LYKNIRSDTSIQKQTDLYNQNTEFIRLDDTGLKGFFLFIRKVDLAVLVGAVELWITSKKNENSFKGENFSHSYSSISLENLSLYSTPLLTN